jgi:LPXTG-motif cell wall-anchored protein
MPDGGFDDTELASIMKFKTTSTSNDTSSTTAPSATSSTTAPSAATSHTGAIAGGVVGGLAAVAVIGLGFFLYRRRKNKTYSSTEAGLPAELHDGDARVEAPATEYSHEVPAEQNYGYYGATKVVSPLTPYDKNPVYTELQGDMPGAVTPVQHS